jgi:hypothetical protein
MWRFLFAADGASDWGDAALVLSAQPSLLGSWSFMFLRAFFSSAQIG